MTQAQIILPDSHLLARYILVLYKISRPMIDLYVMLSAPGSGIILHTSHVSPYMAHEYGHMINLKQIPGDLNALLRQS